MTRCKQYLTLCLLLLAGTAGADTLLNYQINAAVANQPQQFYIQGNLLRTANFGNNYYLYDAATAKLWLVDTSRKLYYPISEHLVNDSLATVNSQMQRLNKLLENKKLPAEARHNIEQAIANINKAQQNVRTQSHQSFSLQKFADTGRQDKHLGVPCDIYQVTTNMASAEVCYGNPATEAAAASTFNSYQQFLSKISGFNSFYALQKGALPLKVTVADGRNLLELQSATNTSRPADFYRLPVGYTDASSALQPTSN